MDKLLTGFQTESMNGLDQRVELLKHLAKTLQDRPDYFGGELGHVPRPGNMMGNTNDNNKENKGRV